MYEEKEIMERDEWNVYNNNVLFEQLEDDGVEPREAAFIQGYMEEATSDSSYQLDRDAFDEDA